MDLNIKISDAIAELMEERGVKADDVREVIEYAESTGKKLYVEGEDRFLARKRMGSFSAYVEYSLGAEVEVIDVYSHQVTFQEDLQ